MRRTGLCVVLMLFTYGISEQARANPPDDKASPAKEASAAYESKYWQKAARLYQQIAETEPQNPRAWYRLAVSLHGIGEQTKAIAAYQKSIEAGLPPALGEYQIALVYASMRDKEKSLEFLKKAAGKNERPILKEAVSLPPVPQSAAES